MTIPTITIIGTGNMGSSLIGGLIKHSHPATNIWATDIDPNKLISLKETFGIHTSTDNIVACRAADVVIFAIKPQIFATTASALTSVIQEIKPLVISIAAGITENQIQKWLGGGTAIVRCMPNTPALYGLGATGLYANSAVTPAQRILAANILQAVGIIAWLHNENDLDAVTALSGSGPAYFFLLMEALQDAALELGLEQETARLLLLQTALGAAHMAKESAFTLGELRRQVTSPGGTTEKAISVLEENNIRHIFKKALHAAKVRSEELGKQSGEK